MGLDRILTKKNKELEERAINRLVDIQKAYGHDKEVMHARADGLLAGLLIDLGFSKVVEEYEKIDKWYA